VHDWNEHLEQLIIPEHCRLAPLRAQMSPVPLPPVPTQPPDPPVPVPLPPRDPPLPVVLPPPVVVPPSEV
jgi:hypothetical protein